MNRPSWSWVRTAGVSVASSLLAAALATVVAVRQNEQQRQAICAIAVALADNAREQAPTTQLGRDNAATWERLRRENHC